MPKKASALNSPAMFVSAVTQVGVQDLMRLTADKLASIPKAKPMDIPEIPVFTLEEETEAFTLSKDADGYHVNGQSIQRLVAQTYWDIDEAVDHVQMKLEKMGVLEALRQAGVEPGDTVFLGNMELEWMW